ncbi:MAG: hypothetical protein MR536_05435, partial [Prevotella sp.]|nr:hypothetical protein [Prevotella sp.]
MANNINKEGLDANESLQKTEVFFDKYKKPLLIGVVALVVIIAGFFIYKSQVAGPRAEKASTS